MNKGKDIDIIFPLKSINTQATGPATEETIKNNINNTFIIDPQGFYGKSYILENGKVLESYLYFKKGYYSRDAGLCREDLIVLQPFQTIHHSINFNKNNRAVYQYAAPNRYEEIINLLITNITQLF
ncbi:hypothetical protein [Chryseobacterium hagamense]|uniref:hypothetical protein n=1 Tax=Chryseobacterium hagamense TaxID=395935 RepID=UPI0011BF2877|nr:hypothetical protein [Chryseobacterium hagamense]